MWVFVRMVTYTHVWLCELVIYHKKIKVELLSSKREECYSVTTGWLRSHISQQIFLCSDIHVRPFTTLIIIKFTYLVIGYLISHHYNNTQMLMHLTFCVAYWLTLPQPILNSPTPSVSYTEIRKDMTKIPWNLSISDLHRSLSLLQKHLR